MADFLNDAKHVIYALIAALFGLGAHVWKKTESRVEALESGKASKKDMDDLENRVDGKVDAAEMDRQRDNISKVFDRLDEYSRRAEDRHRELLTALHEGLARKADR